MAGFEPLAEGGGKVEGGLLPNYLAYLPAGVKPSEVKVCLGLISDTHLGQYSVSLPPVLRDIFRDVDLILHAGDVGNLSVLDALGTIAPVVAVHGNDISAEEERNLPFQQIIAIAGQRILLCHSHLPDWEAEMQSRKEDSWSPKLAERIALGQRMGANMVVFGHWHIPMTYQEDEILLINPGAIASPSVIARQIHKTVALLFILKGDVPVVVHVDVSVPKEPFEPSLAWNEGFRAAQSRYTTSLIDPDFRLSWQPVETYLRELMGKPPYSPVFQALYKELLCISRRCWSGEQPYITRLNLLNMLDEESLGEGVPLQVLLDLRSLLV